MKFFVSSNDIKDVTTRLLLFLLGTIKSIWFPITEGLLTLEAHFQTTLDTKTMPEGKGT